MNISGKINSKRMIIETIIVILITILLFIIFIEYRSVLTAFPIFYLLVEQQVRKRTWSSIGFKVRNIVKDIKSTWFWLIIVVFVSPIVTLTIANAILPDFIMHVKDRLPVDISYIVPTLITITIGTFLEEIIFRGFVQERLSWFLGSTSAIAISSILFGFMHYSSGNPSIVTFDIITIMIDSIIYGIIFLKTKNLFVSWIGHFLCDIVAIVMIWMFI